MDIVKNHKCNNKEDNKWMVFDQFCNEFATDDRDTEHTEIQLLMSLRKGLHFAHGNLDRKLRRWEDVGWAQKKYDERSWSRLIDIPSSISLSRISKNFNQQSRSYKQYYQLYQSSWGLLSPGLLFLRNGYVMIRYVIDTLRTTLLRNDHFYFSLDYGMANSKCFRIIKVGQLWKKLSRKVFIASRSSGTCIRNSIKSYAPQKIYKNAEFAYSIYLQVPPLLPIRSEFQNGFYIFLRSVWLYHWALVFDKNVTGFTWMGEFWTNCILDSFIFSSWD